MTIKNFTLILIFVSFYSNACKNYHEINPGKLVLGDTVIIKYKEALQNEAEGISVLLDSVMNDSRCPIDVECIWAGNAEVQFLFKSALQQTKFNLNTTLSPGDTTIDGYKIMLVALLPFPVSGHQILPDKYYAQISVQKN